MSPARGEGKLFFVPSGIIVPFWGSWTRDVGQTWNYMANETLQYGVSRVKDIAASLLNLPGLFCFTHPRMWKPVLSRHILDMKRVGVIA